MERIQAFKRNKRPRLSSDAAVEVLNPMAQAPNVDSRPLLLPQAHESDQSTPLSLSADSPLTLGNPGGSSSDDPATEKEEADDARYENSESSSSWSYAPVASRALSERNFQTRNPAVSTHVSGLVIKSDQDNLGRDVERTTQEREAAQEASLV